MTPGTRLVDDKAASAIRGLGATGQALVIRFLARQRANACFAAVAHCLH